MIDIHCHLLPGIDDGASTVGQALDLAHFTVADGITHMVFAPHIHPGVYNNLNSITAVFDAFSQTVQEYEILSQLAMAAEVRLCPEIYLYWNLISCRCLLVDMGCMLQLSAGSISGRFLEA